MPGLIRLELLTDFFNKIGQQPTSGQSSRVGGDSNKLVADLDRRNRGQAFQPGHGMVNRFLTAQSTVATRRWGGPAIVTLAAMAALAALTADAAAR